MQFKLRSLFLVMSLICVYCAIVFALPLTASVIALCILTTFLPPVVVSGIIYARGASRAFWIGCAASGFLPFLIAAYLALELSIAVMDGTNLGDEVQIYVVAVVLCHALVGLHGLIVVGMRWFYSAPRAADSKSSSTYAILHRRIALDDPIASALLPRAEERREG